MGGVIGYLGDGRKAHAELIFALSKESNIRGIHAFGIAGGIPPTIVKSRVPFSKDIFIQYSAHGWMMYHNRYSTSGDYTIENNNPPISAGDVIVVGNCVISQSEKSIYEQKWGVSCNTENDIEILACKINSGQNPFSEFTHESFAGLIKTPSKFWVYRNNKRPLHYFNFDGGVFVCSTKDIAERSLYPRQVDVIPVPKNRCIQMEDLWISE